MSDLISRQAAIDKINERQRKLIYCFGFENDMVKIMGIAKSIIVAVPPAQPEIIRCKDCKHYTLKPQVNSNHCYIRHCTRSALISSKPDDYCSWAERREE